MRGPKGKGDQPWWKLPDERDALQILEEDLDLARRPERIEGFDISNLGETETVASMVVFEGGLPRKGHYRRFTVRGDKKKSQGPDDYAALEEVLERRTRRHLEDSQNESFAALPDLILIDGGKGQLSAALKSLQPMLDRGVEVISLAKQEEEVFVPGRRDPVWLDPDEPGLKLLQRVRDEAHRFAITHHRGRKRKSLIGGSALDEVPGLGPNKKRALLRRFGSPAKIGQASVEELTDVQGINDDLARLIREQLG